MRRFSLRTPLILISAAVIAGVVAVSIGLLARSRPDKKVVVAESGMRNMIAAARSAPDSSAHQKYFVSAYERVLHDLELSGHRITSAVPVAAKINMPSSPQYDARIGIQWLELDQAVSGFYLVDAEGRTVEYPGVFQWNRDEVKWYAATAWRDRVINVVVGPAAHDGESLADEWVRVRPNVIRNGLRAGLITSAGKTEAVDVLIADGLPIGKSTAGNGERPDAKKG